MTIVAPSVAAPGENGPDVRAVPTRPAGTGDVRMAPCTRLPT